MSIGIDATPIRTFSRGRRSNGPELATDPDAGWYVRDGDHRDPDVPVADAMRPLPPARKGKAKIPECQKKTSLRKKYLFGYDAHLIVTRDAEHDAVLLADGTPSPDVLPSLVLGVSLDKPGHRPGHRRPPDTGGIARAQPPRPRTAAHQGQAPIREITHAPGPRRMP
ncbi:hypothetical protein ACFYZE_05490 [Streptomyces sp. NPDC001796]|uniref:hypothetical protein n=1 Tax=Streptomyces sp. NPDC001796 TaxID=3364609 RepID=UPI0036A66A21